MSIVKRAQKARVAPEEFQKDLIKTIAALGVHKIEDGETAPSGSAEWSVGYEDDVVTVVVTRHKKEEASADG